MVRKQLEKNPEMAGILKGSIADAWIKKARKEGIEKGIEKGREEGREEGIEKGEKKEKLISRFEEKVILLAKLTEKRFDAGAISDIGGLPLVFVQEFISGYNQEALQQLLKSVALARQTKEPAVAAEELRKGMAAYGLSKEVIEDYFAATE